MFIKQFGNYFGNCLGKVLVILEIVGIFLGNSWGKFAYKTSNLAISFKKFKNMEVIYENSSNLC